MGNRTRSWARPPTSAPAPLRPRVVDAPAPTAADDFADVRRAMAIELVLEAADAEARGDSPEVVEALREKARAVLRHTPAPRNMAPAPLRGPSSVRIARALAV